MTATTREYARAWYQAHAKEARQRCAVKRKQYHAWFQRLKRRYSCSECGERRPPCIDFHHTEGLRKLDSIATLVKRGVSKTTILDEIAKCIPLCANCHRMIHAKDRPEPIDPPEPKLKVCRVCGTRRDLWPGRCFCKKHYREHQKLVMQNRRRASLQLSV